MIVRVITPDLLRLTDEFNISELNYFISYQQTRKSF